MSVISVDIVTNSMAVASTVCICLYTAFFGIQILMFELSNSPKVNKYFRENYGFFMNFYGRAIFLFSVGFFAVGAGGTGVLSGLRKGKTLETLKANLTLDAYKDWGRYKEWRPLNIEGVYNRVQLQRRAQ